MKAAGQNGADGLNGAPIELRVSDGFIQWRWVGQEQWINLIALEELQGEKGDPGAPGKDGIDGKDGLPGKDGTDGKDGLNGRDGIDGRDGKDGADGQDGTNGKDGANPTVVYWVMGGAALLGNAGWILSVIARKKD